MKKSVLGAFYRSFIESVLTFGFLCWYGGLSVKNKTLLDRVVNVCGKVIGEKQESLRELYECRAVRKGSKIARDTTHVLAKYYAIFRQVAASVYQNCPQQEQNAVLLSNQLIFSTGAELCGRCVCGGRGWGCV